MNEHGDLDMDIVSAFVPVSVVPVSVVSVSVVFRCFRVVVPVPLSPGLRSGIVERNNENQDMSWK